MSTGDAYSAADNFHRIADEAVRRIVHTESHIDVGQVRHVVFGKLFHNGAEESPIRCPLLCDVPPESAHTERRAETATQLFILAEHLQTPRQSGDDNGEFRFLDLFFQPICNVVHNARLTDIDEVLELIQRQQTYMTALERLAQADALADRVAARP